MSEQEERPRTRKSFGSGADLGDFLFFLPTVKHLGGGALYAMKGLIPRIPIMQDLIESQDYITSFGKYQGQHLDYNVLDFRKGGIPYGVQLARNQSNWLKVKPDFSKPWLEAEPNPSMKGRIVVNRTPRYQNALFPWRKLVEMFREEMVFVGLPQEHHDFCRTFEPIEYLPTKTLLQVAQAISGAELFIGNQSSPNAICEGLKAPLVQETCLFVPDCVFPRKNAIHCVDGVMEFEACGKHFKSSAPLHKAKIDTSVTPPGGWKLSYDGETAKCYAWDAALLQIKTNLKLKGKEVPPNLKELILSDLQEKIAPPTELLPVKNCRELVQRLYAGEPV